MRIAWFRHTAPDVRDPRDDSASLIDALRSTHQIDVILERNAHDVVWQHSLRPWDLCVYELDRSRTRDFIWAYLLNYPGVLMLRSTDVAHLRVALLASRCVVTSGEARAELLRAQYPQVNVRCGGPVGSAPLRRDQHPGGAAKIAVFDDRPRDAGVVTRALQRARDAGAVFDLLEPDADATLIDNCDVLIAPAWPPCHHASTAVLAGMAAGKAVVTMEMDATAEWPAMDPQTWRPRGIATHDAPIAVTIDPRDEEHSLMLVIRRLSSDAALRAQLGQAARAWWSSHATPAHAARAWNEILQEAVRLSPPPRPDDWPAQFGADGTELTRAIFSELGLPPTDILARS